MIITSLTCYRDRKMLAILAVTIAMISSAPRPSSDFSLHSALRSSSDQRSGGKLAIGKDWGLNPAAIAEFKNTNLDNSALKHILRYKNINICFLS